MRIDFLALNHFGHFVPEMTEEYTFTAIDNADDIDIVWLGENADNGKYSREKSDLIQIHDTAAKSYKAALSAKEHYLFRVLLGNGVQAAILGLKIVDPNGDEIAS